MNPQSQNRLERKMRLCFHAKTSRMSHAELVSVSVTTGQ